MAATDVQVGDMIETIVIVCTYNRWRNFAHALESIAASQVPNSISWKIWTVYSNSSGQMR